MALLLVIRKGLHDLRGGHAYVDHLAHKALGKMGGKASAKRGPEYFRKIAGMRKTRAVADRAEQVSLSA